MTASSGSFDAIGTGDPAPSLISARISGDEPATGESYPQPHLAAADGTVAGIDAELDGGSHGAASFRFCHHSGPSGWWHSRVARSHWASSAAAAWVVSKNEASMPSGSSAVATVA